jgi:hypothetical protein
MNWETAPPVNIIGDGVKLVGGNWLNTQSTTSAIVIASGVTGALNIEGTLLQREAGAGAFGGVAMINATAAASTFTTILSNTSSKEWPWTLTGGTIRLVTGGISRYKNHRMNITSTDPNTYTLNTPIDSMLPDGTLDRLGYTTGLTGWSLFTSASGTTMTQSTNAGPPGYNAFQIHLHATGQAIAAGFGGAAIQVHPGELFWVSAFAFIDAGSTGTTQFGVEIATVNSGSTSFINVADATAIGAGAWVFVEGPVVIPASGGIQFMAPGMQCTGTADMFLTDVRVRRAG